MQRFRRAISALLTLAILSSAAVPAFGAEVPVEPPVETPVTMPETTPEVSVETVLPQDTLAVTTAAPVGTLLSQGKAATASSREADLAKLDAAGAFDGVTGRYETAGTSENVRWSSKALTEGPQWIYVDLGAEKTVQSVQLDWENSYATAYTVEYSNNTSTWTTAETVTAGTGGNVTFNLASAVEARYVRMHATARGGSSDGIGVCLWEMRVFGAEPVAVVSTNLAAGKPATASSIESNREDVPYAKFNPNYVTDGKKSREEVTPDDFRWSSKTCNATNPQWIQVDLGTPQSFEAVKIYWEDAYASKYTVQISDDATTWETIATNNAGAAGLATHKLGTAKTARYVRVHATERAGAAGTTISIWELEVYNVLGDTPLPTDVTLAQATSDLRNRVSEMVIKPNATMPTYTYTKAGGGTLTARFFCNDVDQIVSDAGQVLHYPIVDKKMLFTYKITDSTDNSVTEVREMPVVVAGSGTAGANARPVVVPTLQEWNGAASGVFTLAAGSRIVVPAADAAVLTKAAQIVKADIKELFGFDVAIVDTAAQAGDIVLTMQNIADQKLGDQGYKMEVGDYVTVAGTTYRGVFFGTRSVLQALVASKTNTIAKGLAYDYPNYPVRKSMLDVARKYFPMWYLEDWVKYSAWMKYTDIHVHFSDNTYTDYSAYRIESSVPHLTAKDGYYTKEEYRAFQTYAADYGINVLSEVESPAHALPFMDIAKGFTDAGQSVPPEYANLHLEDDNTQKNPHFDLRTPEQRAKVKALMTKVYDELLGGPTPVITTGSFNIGTDEYPRSEKAGMQDYTKWAAEKVRSYGKDVVAWNSIGFTGAAQATGGDTEHSELNADAIAHTAIDMWGANSLGNDGAMCDAGYKSIIDQGYTLINSDVVNYIVPGGLNGIRDYVDAEDKYNNFTPAHMTYGTTDRGRHPVTEGYPKLVGGTQCIWNDAGAQTGMTAFDIFDRQKAILPTISEIFWCGKQSDLTYYQFNKQVKDVGKAPSMQVLDENVKSKSEQIYLYNMENTTANGANLSISDTSGNGYTATAVNATAVGGALSFTGNGYITTPNKEQSWPMTTTFDLKMNAGQTGNVTLFQRTMPAQACMAENAPIKIQPNGFETNSISLKRQANGNYKLGYDREGRTYLHPYEFIPGTQYKIALTSDSRQTKLYVNDAEVSTLRQPSTDPTMPTLLPHNPRNGGTYGDIGVLSNAMGDGWSGSMSLPLERIGEGLNGTIDNLAVYNRVMSTSQLDPSLVPQSGMTATASSAAYPAPNAIDGDETTFWVSNYAAPSMPQSLTLFLGDEFTVDRLTYLPRNNSGAAMNGTILTYDIELSTDGANFHKVYSGTWADNNTRKTATFPAEAATHLRLVAKTASGVGNDALQASALEVNVYKATKPAPVITTQPASTAVLEVGATATFTVAATGAGSYQWQKQAVGGITWENIAGAISPSYTTAAVTAADSGIKYRCVLQNADKSASVISAAATLSVKQPPVAGTLSREKSAEEYLAGESTVTMVPATNAADLHSMTVTATAGQVLAFEKVDFTDGKCLMLEAAIPAGSTGKTIDLYIDSVSEPNKIGTLTTRATAKVSDLDFNEQYANLKEGLTGEHKLLMKFTAATTLEMDWLKLTSYMGTETKEQRDARMGWWRDAHYGEFMHFGAYSQLGGTYKGTTLPNGQLSEWIMSLLKIPKLDYQREAAEKFNPSAFDPVKIVADAKSAGAKYLVITSRHHEGFSIFDTKVRNFKDYSLFSLASVSGFNGRDIMGELSAECKKQGLHFGVYTTIMDWHDPAQSGWNNPASGDVGDQTNHINEGFTKEGYKAQLKGQLKELIEKYGTEVFFFDGEWVNWWSVEDGKEMYRFLLSLNEKCIVNNRVGKRHVEDGDYGTPEGTVPATGLSYDWESCFTMNDSWGYKPTDKNWKTPQWIVSNVVGNASKGGNMLLNVGPDGTGVVEAEPIANMNAAGVWFSKFGESLYGTRANCYSGALPTKVVVTTKDAGKVYVHLMEDAPATRSTLVIPSLTNAIVSVKELANGNPVPYTKTADAITLNIVGTAKQDYDTVYAIEVIGKPTESASASAGGNLAKGKTVTASTTYPSQPATHAVDGDWATRWAPDDTVTPAHLTIDLGKTTEIKKIVMGEWQENTLPYRCNGFKIAVSDDGNTWSAPIHTGTGIGAKLTIDLPTVASGRYVKIYDITSGQAGANPCLYEVQLFAPASEIGFSIPSTITTTPFTIGGTYARGTKVKVTIWKSNMAAITLPATVNGDGTWSLTVNDSRVTAGELTFTATLYDDADTPLAAKEVVQTYAPSATHTYAQLQTLLGEANTLKSGTLVAASAAEVATGDFWATSANISTFANAITTATAVQENAGAAAIESAYNALLAAKTTFEGQRTAGTMAAFTYAQLQAAITTANSSKAAVKTSVNGADVSTTEKWATSANISAFANAITTATAVQTGAGATAITKAYNALLAAQGTFNSQCQNGTQGLHTLQELTAAIAAAQTFRDSVQSSANGAEVLPSKLWATPANIGTFNSAITAADTVAKKSGATASEISGAYTALAAARTTFEGQCQSGRKALIIATSAQPAQGDVSMETPSGTLITDAATIKVNDLVKLYAAPKANQRFVKWVRTSGGGTPSMDTFAFEGTQIEYTANPLVLRAADAIVLQAEFAALDTVTVGNPVLEMLTATATPANARRDATQAVVLIGTDGTEGFQSDASVGSVLGYNAYLLNGETNLVITPVYNPANSVTVGGTAATIASGHTGNPISIAVNVDGQQIPIVVTAGGKTTTYTITAHTTAASPKMELQLHQKTATLAEGKVLVSGAHLRTMQFTLAIDNPATTKFTDFAEANGTKLTDATKNAGFVLTQEMAQFLTVSAITYDATTKSYGVTLENKRNEALPIDGAAQVIGSFYLQMPAGTSVNSALASLKTATNVAGQNTLFDVRYRGLRDDGLNNMTTSLVTTSAQGNVKLYTYVVGAPGMAKTRITMDVFAREGSTTSTTAFNATPIAANENGRVECSVPAGTYVIKVYAGGYLTYVSAPVTVGAADTYVTGGTLVAGELTGNAAINADDRAKLLTVFNQAAANGKTTGDIFADFNDDGRVNAIDLGRLLLNYTK